MNSYDKCPICGRRKDTRAQKCAKCHYRLTDHAEHLGKYALKGAIPWNKGLRGVQAGENSPHWKGGITTLAHVIRNSPEYATWRTRVFKRDDFECQDCHGRNGLGKAIILNAHHIIPFSEILTANSITSLPEALVCDVLWDIDNAVTLCIDCHNKTKKGRRPNGN